MNDFKGTSVIEHEIPLNDTRPIRKPQYRVPYALREEMQTQSRKHAGQRRNPGKPIPLVSPAILVPKKSLDGKLKFRFCVNFRALNSVTKFDSYPLPVIDETTSTLYGPIIIALLTVSKVFGK